MIIALLEEELRYLDANGQTSYRDAVSQKSADKLIEEWRIIANTSKIASE